jgi:hypothetical protein
MSAVRWPAFEERESQPPALRQPLPRSSGRQAQMLSALKSVMRFVVSSLSWLPHFPLDFRTALLLSAARPISLNDLQIRIARQSCRPQSFALRFA